MTDVDAVRAAVAAMDAEDPLGTVVNNAGIGWSAQLLDVTPERFDELVAVNLRRSDGLAEVIAFLASERSCYMTGSYVSVD